MLISSYARPMEELFISGTCPERMRSLFLLFQPIF